MKVLPGISLAENGVTAVKEIAASWRGSEKDIGFIIFFQSLKQDPEQVAKAFSECFPGIPVAGCTTAGEHFNQQRHNGSIVACAVTGKDSKWTVGVLADLGTLTADRAEKFAEGMAQSLGIAADGLDSSKNFCIAMIDGLSMKEEGVVNLMGDALRGIPFVGGSAGDDLKFTGTFVMANGKAYRNSAVFVLAETTAPFHMVKHQHFLRSERDLVVTRVESGLRRVKEIDGVPASHRYAEILGVPVEQLGPQIFSSNPLTFTCNNEVYVRSIQTAEPDGTLVFSCAIEEGMVLEIGAHLDMETTLRRDLAALTSKVRKPIWFLGINCILRSLEALQDKNQEALNRIMAETAPCFVGFDSYGEQLDGMHINQTLVGIIFEEAA